MTRREFERINKAIKYFMQEEPDTPDEHAKFKGWTGGMDILDDLRRAYKRRAERSKSVS